MKPTVLRFDNANALHYALVNAIARIVTSTIEKGRNPVLGLPTGNTMVPFYRIAAELESELQVSRWSCFNLDEYYPLREENQSLSFKHYMDLHFYSRLKHPPEARFGLDGHTQNLELECGRYEKLLQEHGGLDLAILGIGVNGHIAFNEPGSEFDTRTRAIELHPQTLMANFKGQAPFTHALTMGIGTILEAKQIFIVAIGKNKANAVKAAIEDPLSRTVPASGLQKHAQVTWFLDQEAASLL